jgi:hypothetical protein
LVRLEHANVSFAIYEPFCPLLITQENRALSIRLVEISFAFSLAHVMMDGDSPRVAIKRMGDVTQMLVSYGIGGRAVLDALFPWFMTSFAALREVT